MSRGGRILGFGLVALVGIALVGVQSGEPRYHGRSLTGWLVESYNASLEETGRIARAEGAVRAIGSTNALPFLLEMVETTNGPVRTWLARALDKTHVGSLRIRDAREVQQLGLVGFDILQSNCAPAVPQLTWLMSEPNRASIAIECLARIGKAAEAPICRGLTNADPATRSLCASRLAWVTDDTDAFLARLKPCLGDPAPSVRAAAVEGIGYQTHAPNQAIPMLVSALQDKNDRVCGSAADLLGKFGTNALCAFGALSNAIEMASDSTARNALKTMIAISPVDALPTVLRFARSPLPGRRSSAVVLLANYPEPIPEVIAALKQATLDPDRQVAVHARNCCLKLRERLQKSGAYAVVIPSEPSYAGKTLGEWLKTCKGAASVPPDVQAVVRQLGTKAIPALLERLAYCDPLFGLSDNELAMEAVTGMISLGEQASPAGPKLQELINGQEERIAIYALPAACNMGTNSMPILIGALTNQYADVRNEALNLLTEGPVKTFPDVRKRATPEIARLLSDPDEFVRMGATNALREIDPKTARSAGVK